MSDKKSFLEFAKAIIPTDLQKKLSEAWTKFNAVPAPAAAPVAPVALDKTMKTKDGALTISVAGDPAIGVAVKDISTGSPVDLADGTYELEDGSSIVVAGGTITTYTPAAAPVVPGMEDMTAKFSAQFSAQEVKLAALVETKFKEQNEKIKELESTISDLTKTNGTLLEFANKIIETPIEDKPAPNATPDNWEKMTGREKQEWRNQQKNK